MNVSIIIATCGSQDWSDLAWSRAYPTADAATVALSSTFYPEARGRVVIQHYPELSVSRARNAAAASAMEGPGDPADWFCFLDGDDQLERGYLVSMAAAYLDDAYVSLAGPLLVPAVRYVRQGEWVTPDSGPYPTLERLSAAAIPNRGRWPAVNECVVGTLVRADLFRTVGGFRERTTDGTELTSLEDYDLWLRCHDAGARLVYVEDAVYLAHVNPAGGRNRDQSPYDAIWRDHLARVEAAKDV